MVKQSTHNRQSAGSIPASPTRRTNLLGCQRAEIPPLAQGIEQQPSKLWVRRSIRLGRARFTQQAGSIATVVELVYTRDLKSRAYGIEGSSPSGRTKTPSIHAGSSPVTVSQH